MSFAARRSLEPNAVAGGAQAGAYNDSGLTLNANGTRTLTGFSSGPVNWYVPPFSGVGAFYWVRGTKTGGSVTLTPATGTWNSLASGVAFSATGGAGNVTGNLDFSTDSGGSTIVASGTFSVNNTL